MHEIFSAVATSSPQYEKAFRPRSSSQSAGRALSVSDAKWPQSECNRFNTSRWTSVALSQLGASLHPFAHM